MKASYINKTGSPDNIIYGELDLPEISENDVLVEVEAVTVNPIDCYIRSGFYKIDLDYPFIIGRDMVGSVVKCGSLSNRIFFPGDKVWCNNQGYAGRQGTFSEYLSIDANLLYKMPENIDSLNLVASVHSALTAVCGLIDKAHLCEGETIFLRGGSGNLGQATIQLAKKLGAKVIATAGDEEKKQVCLDNRADLVINYHEQNIYEQVSNFSPNGISVYWDMTKEADLDLAINLLAKRGKLILSSGINHSANLNIGKFYTKNCSILGFTITELSTVELSNHARILNELFKENVFKSQIYDIFDLKDAANAHRLLEEKNIFGKIILKPG